MGLEVFLCDANPEVLRAWRSAFRDTAVSIEGGDFFDIEVDAYVSPANSYGYMDGGFDLLLRERFPNIEHRVQQAIGGFLIVGSAVVVETGDPFIPYLVFAPTMETPCDVSTSSNAYLATRAALRVARSHGQISSIAFPGMATGIGGMPGEVAAAQMFRAYDEHLAETCDLGLD